MSMYEDNDGDGLYSCDSVEFNSATAQPTQQPEPEASEAAGKALQAIVAPSSLLTEVLPADPSESKIPMGLAILGLCIVGIVWAGSLDKK